MTRDMQRKHLWAPHATRRATGCSSTPSVKPPDLNTVDWHVRQRNPSASAWEVQNETLEVNRGLVSDGLFTLGGAFRRSALRIL
jgi:hypothetical protein